MARGHFAMKYIIYLVLIIGAYFLGKGLYGPLAPIMVGSEEKGSIDGVQLVTDVKVKSPMGTVTETVDLNNLTPEDYPAKIELTKPLTLTNEEGGDPLPLDAGSPVNPLSLSGTTLTVTSPLAKHLTAKVSVSHTDFVKSVANTRMDRRLSAASEKNEEQQSEEPGKPEPDPKQTTEPEVAHDDSDDGMEAAEPEPEEEPEPEPKEPEGATNLSEEQIIAKMKESLQSGNVKELSFDTVQEWQKLEDESFDGQDFQVGLAIYEEMTILGKKTLQAKALFRDGELTKWIHAKTGMQIR
jgi:hypothetical protein